jgi:hypothetical protein
MPLPIIGRKSLTCHKGQFRESLPSDQMVIGATKWCVFRPIPISREVVEAAVLDRTNCMRTERVDLLQVSDLL